MAKRPKKDEGGEVHADTTARTNGINEQQLKGFIAEAEAEMLAMDDIMTEATELCQPHKDQLKEIVKAAAEAGIAKQVFRAKLRERGLKRKADKCRAGLNEKQQAEFDEVSQKLGELKETLGPLGEAAFERHQAGAAAH